ncbi:hypothetical protein [Photobacterium galatheae]|uniref:Uncharacterized protein n=1 Tax=Photobacterium galatheae TaxID=1654360 RepID=A0A066RTB8_9GAMM|nr:hypothetical protein [Photobacterium galatheae]KDM90952.1 hypothetical protein EA58_14450 [Photobacterium galatheae]MCM0149084.1 hypothetical protein [Photobacterium galatheae]
MANPSETARKINMVIGLVTFILVTAGFSFATFDFMMGTFCDNAHGINTEYVGGWMIEVCKDHYWDNRYGGRNGWE